MGVDSPKQSNQFHKIEWKRKTTLIFKKYKITRTFKIIFNYLKKKTEKYV